LAEEVPYLPVCLQRCDETSNPRSRALQVRTQPVHRQRTAQSKAERFRTRLPFTPRRARNDLATSFVTLVSHAESPERTVRRVKSIRRKVAGRNAAPAASVLSPAWQRCSSKAAEIDRCCVTVFVRRLRSAAGPCAHGVRDGYHRERVTL
jgi:hypothetical protein